METVKELFGSFFCFKHQVSIKFFIPLILVFCSWSVSGQKGKSVEEVYELIYSLKLDEAKSEIAILEKSNISPVVVSHMENSCDFYRLFFSENPVEYENLRDIISERVSWVDADKVTSPEEYAGMLDMALQQTILCIKFNEYWRAGVLVFRLQKLWSGFSEKYPRHILKYKYNGLLLLVFGSIPDEYGIITDILGMEGDINKGIQMLEKFYSETNENRIENSIILALCYNHFLSSPEKGMGLIEKEFASDFSNPLIRYVYCSLLFDAGKSNKVSAILKDNPQTDSEQPIQYFHYMNGMSQLYNLNTGAEKELLAFVDEFEGLHFIKAAYLKLFWNACLIGNDQKKSFYSQKVLTEGNALIEPDKQAVAEIEKRKHPNTELLKARLLFDGGNYDQAVNLLKNLDSAVSTLSTEDQIEYFYRLARVYDKSKKFEQALAGYSRVLELGKESEVYYIAYSAYCIGKIYEDAGKVESAEKFYKMCLGLNSAEYKNSIEQKAKAGLSRLKK